ncbi:cupin domain-containing protein [Nocardia sp. XZ_19_369]|uniref:cupin domain-containing protein n=1 Tax=Nocardia sp. XZ_19_369 TaxID=2769487 RepID=UPI00188FE027|nr:cupin domain-containing protein [Nocardia sp. XZ_19_369]
MTLIQHTETRRTETPGGVMTTLASPTQGGTALALWRVEVPADKSGPVHIIDTEQVWTVVAGSLTVDLDGTKLTAAEGDTVIMPANVLRQVHTEHGFTAIVTAQAGAKAGVQGSDTMVVPPWIA